MERRRTCAVLLLLPLSFLSRFGQCEARNILVIDAVPSPSHQIWMRALSSALGNSGHNVTLLTMPTIGNVVQENVHPLFMPELWEWMQSDMDIDILEMANMGSYVKLFAFLTFYDPQNQRALNSTGYKALLNYPKDFKFDLMIYDYLSAYSLLSLKEFFNDPPLVAVSPYPGIGVTNVMTGGPELFSFVPHMLKDTVQDCFWDRLENFLVSSMFNFLEQYYILPVGTKAVRKILPDQVQTMNELLLSSTIQLANYHPTIDCVHPIMPSVIPVGGLQIAEPKPLPKDLEEIYSLKSMGNVLFSLGSNVKSEDLGVERLNELIGALEELPDYNFIWKIDLKGLDLKMPKNVFIRKWLPQNDMLADKRTVLFMSHAGGLSTQECTWYGVPMLALPVMFDQFPVSLLRLLEISLTICCVLFSSLGHSLDCLPELGACCEGGNGTKSGHSLLEEGRA